MLSNYPPGVTGNERAIAGCDREFDARRRCDECGEWSEVTVQVSDTIESWDCPIEECQAENEVDTYDEWDYDEDTCEDRERGLF
jgi:hypothetical protein